MSNGTVNPGASSPDTTAASNPQLAAELQTALEAQLPGIIAQTSRKFNIDRLKADSGTIGDLDIDKIILGDATIERIVLTDTSASLIGAHALMQDVRTVLELRFTLDWEVDLGWLGSWDGSENLGALNFAMNVGNVSIPSLSDINMHIPSMSISGSTLAMRPINKLDLGGAVFRKMEARNTDAPAGGFSMSGFGVGSVAIENVDIPRTSTEQVLIQEFSPNRDITLPGAEIRDLRIPAAQIDNIRTDGFEFAAVTPKRCLDVDLGILELNICVRPVIHMNIGAMVIQDAEISAVISKLGMDNLAVPLTIRGIAMKDLNVNTIKINRISL